MQQYWEANILSPPTLSVIAMLFVNITNNTRQVLIFDIVFIIQNGGDQMVI